MVGREEFGRRRWAGGSGQESGCVGKGSRLRGGDGGRFGVRESRMKAAGNKDVEGGR